MNKMLKLLWCENKENSLKRELGLHNFTDTKTIGVLLVWL